MDVILTIPRQQVLDRLIMTPSYSITFKNIEQIKFPINVLQDSSQYANERKKESQNLTIIDLDTNVQEKKKKAYC